MKKLILLIPLLFMFSCVSQSSYIPVERFHKIVNIGGYTVHFCSHRSMFNANYNFYHKGISGGDKRYVDGFYDDQIKEIWVLAYKDKAGIQPLSQCLLGHEWQHAINHIDNDIADPDTHP